MWPKPNNQPSAQSSKMAQARTLVNQEENLSMLSWLLLFLCLLQTGWWIKQVWDVLLFWRWQNNFCLLVRGWVSPIKPSIPQSWWKGLEKSEMITCFLPSRQQHFPPARASCKAASRWQLCPTLGMLEALRGSSLSSLIADTREQLSVQSQARFNFTVVTDKGYDNLPSNRGLCVSKGKKLFKLKIKVVTNPKDRNWLWNHVDWMPEEGSIEISEQRSPRAVFHRDIAGKLSAQRRSELAFSMRLCHQEPQWIPRLLPVWVRYLEDCFLLNNILTG